MNLKERDNSKCISLRKGCHYNHFTFWFDALREGASLVEDATIGNKATAPAFFLH